MENTPHGFEWLIAWRTGLQMRQEDKEKWRAIIHSRSTAVGLSSLEEYYQLLISDTDRSETEWRELIGVITTSESYFFRDKGQFSIIRNIILPELIERRQKDRSLRIWSAGCSTGEEPYSIAMLIDELCGLELNEEITHSEPRIPHLKDWDVLILGTDINEKAIEKAKKGMYGQWSFRMTDPDLRKRYFKNRVDVWELDEKIRRMVKFRTGNLMENSFPDIASDIHDMDLILCRNVFIYFNSVSVAIVLEKFTDTLNEGGYLMTGHGELYGQSFGRLLAKMFPESVAYQKISECGVRSAELQEKTKEIKIEKPIAKERYESKITDAKTEQKVSTGKISHPEDSALSTPHSELANHISRAQEYADRGQYDKADAECKKALEIDNAAAKIYFLLAHIAEIKGNTEEAKDLLKRIIYLAPDFIAAYLELAGLYERENDAERAKKMRLTAIELLKALPSETAIEPYKEIAAGELLEYMRKML